MNWKECVQLNERYDLLSRFEWPGGDGKAGFDCNPDFTFNDVWGAVSWLWTWPGDYLLNLPEVKSFFELGPETVVGSAWSMALGWLFFLFLIGGLNSR
jgi:hypothetical protein